MIEAENQTVSKISWEDFLQNASIEKEASNRWRVSFQEQIFITEFESFVMFPRPLAGCTAFRLSKYESAEAQKAYKESWKIHVRADLYDYNDAEILRLVWCHLDRIDGDYCELYEYDRLDKSRPEDAIGEPVDINGVKRWKIRCGSMGSMIVEKYIYVASDGRCEDVILVQTINGYKWETSINESRHNSLKSAERKILKHLQQ